MTRPVLRCCIFLIAVLTLLVPASAVPSAENAALRYWRAWSMMGDDDVYAEFEFDYGKYDPKLAIGDYDGVPIVKDGVPYTAESLLDAQQYNIDRLIRAAAMEKCDFGLDYELGLDALMPHVGPMRASVRLLLLDAERLMNQEESRAAAERCAAAIQVSRHMLNDGFLLNSLVSMQALECISEWITAHSAIFDDTERRVIRDALARYDSEDPFRLAHALQAERQVIGDWLRKLLGKEWITPEHFAESLSDDESWGTAMTSLAESQLCASDQVFREQMLGEIQKFEEAISAAERLWASPDRGRELRLFYDQIDSGLFGSISQELVPALGKLSRTQQRVEPLLASLRVWAAN